MITLKQESLLLKKLKSLTELELRSLFEDFSDHLYRNNLEEVILKSLSLTDQDDTIARLQDELDEANEEALRWENKCDDAREILEDIETIDDDSQKQIDKAIEELS